MIGKPKNRKTNNWSIKIKPISFIAKKNYNQQKFYLINKVIVIDWSNITPFLQRIFNDSKFQELIAKVFLLLCSPPIYRFSLLRKAAHTHTYTREKESISIRTKKKNLNEKYERNVKHVPHRKQKTKTWKSRISFSPVRRKSYTICAD